MSRLIALLMVTLLLAGAALAQPDPGPNGGNPQPPGAAGIAIAPMWQYAQYAQVLLRTASTVLKSTPQGIFVLQNGTLVRFDPRTGEAGPPLDLYGAAPEMPGDNAAPEGWQAYFAALARRAQPAAMVVQGTDLIVATVDCVWRIELATTAVKAKILLPDPPPDGMGNNPQANPAQLLQAQQAGAPVLDVIGSTVYLVRRIRLTAVDLTAGKVLFDRPLPAGMAPPNLQELIRRFRPVPINNPPNGGNPGPGGQPNPNPGMNPQPNGNPITLVGLVRRVNLEGGFWTLEANNGMKYVLAGDKLRNLVGNGNIEGARVRVTGTVQNRPGVAQYGNGALVIAEFEVLVRPGGGGQ